MKKLVIPFLLLSTIAMGKVTVGKINGEVNRKNIRCEWTYPQFKLNGKSLSKLNNTFVKDAKELKITTPKTTDDFRPWDRNINFKVYDNTYGFKSVIIYDRLYTGDKHIVTRLRNVNLDEKTGKVLDFNDIFREEMNGRVKRAIVKYLNRKNIEKGIPFINPINEEEISLNNAVFFFDRDFLIVKFESHTVAPFVSKEKEFKFAKDNVIPYMVWKYRKNFPEFYNHQIKRVK